MTPPRSGAAVGLVLVATLLWSTGGAVTRHVQHATPVEMVYWRGLFAFLFIGIFLLMKRQNPLRAARASSWPGLFSGAMWAVMFTSFMLALSFTTTANILVVQSVAPLLTAFLARLLLTDPLPRSTLVATAVAGFGIAWMFGAGFEVHSARDIAGMLISFLIPVAGAANLIVLRKTGASVDMVPAVMIGAALSSLAALPFALPFSASGSDVALLAFLGFFQLGLPCMLMVIAARSLLAPHIALLCLLEVVLGTLWAWLAANEVPAAATLLGGSIVLAALILNELSRMRAAAVSGVQ